MSRLDAFIRRMVSARACLDRGARLIGDLPGPVLELGLGNGRTFDHLREILPGRDIFVFERAVAAHPDCIPAADRLILGDLRETLVAARSRFEGQAALAHVDTATHDMAASRKFAAEFAPLLAALMRPGAVVASEPPLPASRFLPLPLPEEAEEGRYHFYRVA